MRFKQFPMCFGSILATAISMPNQAGGSTLTRFARRAKSIDNTVFLI
jgi:hypothetical protein